MYKLVKNVRTNEVDHVQNLSSMSFIPFDLDNTDFKEFLKLLENDFSILQTPDGKQADQGTIKAILKGKN